MSIDSLTAEQSQELLAESYAPATPFSQTFEFDVDQRAGELEAANVVGALESPFRSESPVGENEGGPNAEQAGFEGLVSSLYESEFSEALYEVAAEAAVAAQEQLGAWGGETPADREQLMEQYMASPATEAEATFGRLAEQYAQHDISGLSEQEIDRLFESLQPSFEHLSPAFENLFGGIWNKVKSVAKGAVNLAKKGIAAVGKIVPLGWIFDKLKKLIRPLLKRVLQFAIGRLPTPLQPVARKLATRFFGEAEDELPEAEDFMTPASASPPARMEALAATDTDAVQREFDTRVATLLFARDEAEEQEAAGEFEAETQAGEDQVTALTSARDRFVQEVVQSERGQDLSAQMENFIPAILAALRIGISIVGRPRVIGYLAKLLSGLVAPYVGSQIATQLASAIVSTGMSMIGLEAPADREQLAGEAVANAVEGTLSRLAEQGEQIFEDQRVLEAAVQEAFAEAAAESFPQAMIREQFHEVSPRMAQAGTWVLAPSAGRRRYRRYTRTLDVRLTRQIARSVEVFGGIRLDAFLRSRYGITAPTAMRAHLYQAIPGTKLSTIARLETGVSVLGPRATRGWRYFIPLTRATAGLLFGEPGLGRDVSPQFLRASRRTAVGQRFLVLEPIGAHPRGGGLTGRPTGLNRTSLNGTSLNGTGLNGAGRGGTRTSGRSGRASQVNVTLDVPRETIRVHIYLTEAETQAVAASVRRGESVTPVLVLLRNVYVAAVRSMFSGNARRHVKIVNEVTETESEGFLGAIGEGILNKVADKVIAWLGTALAEYFTRRGQEFLAAASNPAEGVTIIVTLRHGGLIQVLRSALRGEGVGGASALARALISPVDASLQTVPGFRS